jgi:uncharacterized protein (DUF2252 family)
MNNSAPKSPKEILKQKSRREEATAPETAGLPKTWNLLDTTQVVKSTKSIKGRNRLLAQTKKPSPLESEFNLVGTKPRTSGGLASAGSARIRNGIYAD